MKQKISSTDLIRNRDGSVYHLALRPDEIGSKIILVGDPERVRLVSSFFDRVHIRRENREFRSHTGSYRGHRISVISTGIGHSGVEIVMQELDALVNIDFKTLEVKDELKSLDIYRIGTTGALDPEIEPGQSIIMDYTLGLDNLMKFYPMQTEPDEAELAERVRQEIAFDVDYYVVKANQELSASLDELGIRGMAIVAPGFYASQGRALRTPIYAPDLIHRLAKIEWNGLRFTNVEMEASVLYGMSRVLGHRAVAMDLVLANRTTDSFLSDYKQAMEALIWDFLDNLVGEYSKLGAGVQQD